MKKHAFIVFLVSVYILTQVFIEFGKVLLDVGAAKLKDFTWADWVVMIIPTMGTVGVTVLAFFSRAFATHMSDLEKSDDTKTLPDQPKP